MQTGGHPELFTPRSVLHLYFLGIPGPQSTYPGTRIGVCVEIWIKPGNSVIVGAQ